MSEGKRWTVIGVEPARVEPERAIYAKGPKGLKIGDELADASEVERLREALERIGGATYIDAVHAIAAHALSPDDSRN